MPKKKTAGVKEVAELSDKQAKKLAERILRCSAESEVGQRTTIGQWILAEVFGGSEAEFRSLSPTKGRSLQKLAAQPGMADAGWSRNTLDRAVELYLLTKGLKSFSAWPHLQPTHFEQIFGLETAKQKELLDQAEQNGWSVKQLAEAMGKKWATGAPGEASPPAPRTFKSELAFAMSAIERLSSFQDGLGTLALEAKFGVTTEETTKLYNALMEVHGILSGWQERSGIEIKSKNEMVPIEVEGFAPGQGPMVSVAKELLELAAKGKKAVEASRKKRR